MGCSQHTGRLASFPRFADRAAPCARRGHLPRPAVPGAELPRAARAPVRAAIPAPHLARHPLRPGGI